jgi:radical SAM superfamily enzyme YgiQ (UPF0313 family)
MKLLLVSPAQLTEEGKPLRVKKTFIIPLSIYLLAGLTPKDWDIELVNDYTDDIDYDGGYDLVGITATTLHSERGFQIAAEFKKRGTKVVIGGFHPTLFPDIVKEHCDAIVIGEAELVWKRVLEDAAKDALQPVYKADSLSELNDQPVPGYEYIKKSKYINDIMPVECTRGCPYNCEYCSVTQFYGNKYRHRPVEQVVRDIKACGSRFINFVDDNIAGKASYAKELFEALSPLNLFWVSQVSIRLADDEKLLALSAKSGFRYAIIGIETLDESNLAAMGKKKVNRVEEYVAKTKMFRKHGITVAANLMFGFDNDTEETFEKTYVFVKKHLFVPNPYIITPYPGTRLAERWDAEGRILHKDYWRYTSYQTVFRPTNFTPERLDELFVDFFKKVYSIPLIIRRFWHGLSIKRPWGSFMTQLALALNSFVVRKNLHRGILPYY